MEWKYEDEVLTKLVKQIRISHLKRPSEPLLVTALNTCSYLEERRTEIFGKEEFQSLRVKLMSQSFSPFNYGGEACGGYSLFLARVLKKLNYEVRLIQLNVSGVAGGHITLGVEKGDKLLLVDPLFGIAFKDRSGNLSDINDVSKNWFNYYVHQTPPGYEKAYDYQSGWQYTNWDKLGFISRSIYHAGVFVFGKKKMDNISIRSSFLETEKYYFIISLISFFLISSTFAVSVIRNHKRLATVKSVANRREYNFPRITPAIESVAR